MTQEACCALCKKHGDKCKVAVVATDYEGGLGQCLLKASCPKPTAATQRVKCCMPGAGGTDGCAGKPGPPPLACNKALLPTFCDHTKPWDARVAELVGEMTPEEKVGQVGSNGVPGIERLGIPAYQWWGEAQHGVCMSPSVQFRAPTPYGTSFPEPGLSAATFDKELFSAIGEVPRGPGPPEFSNWPGSLAGSPYESLRAGPNLAKPSCEFYRRSSAPRAARWPTPATPASPSGRPTST